MIYTNKHNIPGPLFRAIQADPYSKGESDFSATGLAQPPRAAVLIEREGAQLTVDAITRIDSAIGSGMHTIVERGQRPGIDIVEVRYFSTFNVDGKDYVVSAQIDFFEDDTKILWDWKTTKAYAFHKDIGAKKEWIYQMNVGSLLMGRAGIGVNELKICGILKNWERKESIKDSGYPPCKVMVTNIPKWPEEKTVEYIEARVRAHVAAKTTLPLCTSAEAWYGRRCREWCDAASVCSQYQRSKQTGLIGGESEV